MDLYAAATKTNTKQLKFHWDGEEIDPEATPEDLDFENGECIDVF
jgi:hypothetical protein